MRNTECRRNHINTTTIYIDLGQVLDHTGEIELANDCYFKFLEIAKFHNMQKDPDIAKVLIYIRKIHYKVKESNKAVNFYEEALSIKIELFGKEDTKVAFILNK